MRPLLLLALAGFAASLAAQQPTGIPAVDSAAAARAAWTRAAAAAARGDSATTLREVRRAARAWPTQEAYAWGRVRIEAAVGDTAAFAAALRHLLDLGIGADLTADPATARLAAAPVVAPLVAANARLLAPIARERTVAILPDSAFWPEGMDYDSTSGRYYVASVRYGTIAERRPDGRWRELLPRHGPRIGAILGVRVDPARGVLWATTSGIPQAEGYRPADSAVAALLEVRLADGAIVRRWDLAPAPGGHVLGDLAIGPRGDVFLTDSYHPFLYRLRPGADTLERITSPLFRSLQGMAPTPDGRTLFVADYSHGLLRVDLADGAVTRLADAPHSTSLGCDGIALAGSAIVAVQNGLRVPRVMRFDLDPSGRRIVRVTVLDRNDAVSREPTIGAMVGGDFVYVADGQWNEYDDGGRLRPGVRLERSRLVAAPWRR